jgi:replication factor C subunit 3/5
MLWVDKHRPTTLSKLDYHAELSERLQALVRIEEGDFIHLHVHSSP